MGPNDTLTYRELYANLCVASKNTLPEEFFTTSEFCRDSGKGWGAAVKHLREETKAGRLQTKVALVNGHHTRIFWFAEEKGE